MYAAIVDAGFTVVIVPSIGCEVPSVPTASPEIVYFTPYFSLSVFDQELLPSPICPFTTDPSLPDIVIDFSCAWNAITEIGSFGPTSELPKAGVAVTRMASVAELDVGVALPPVDDDVGAPGEVDSDGAVTCDPSACWVTVTVGGVDVVHAASAIVPTAASATSRTASPTRPLRKRGCRGTRRGSTDRMSLLRFDGRSDVRGATTQPDSVGTHRHS
ncbi:MAG: hypothetical protein BGO26_11765 [Actinobacteria bacterium 69-20]|nr:MAG: hypothetical protein BGO26_11765 [Actinobacteria bacterium 69-20]